MFEGIMRTVRNVFRRRSRNLLTILSIAIGVMSVVLISIIGDMGKLAVKNEIDGLGAGSLAVTADSRLAVTELNGKDLELIRGLSVTQSAIPVIVDYGRVSMHGLIADAIIWGVDSGANQVISLELLYGRLLNREDILENSMHCVIDSAVAQMFYGRDNITGKQIQLVLGGERHNFTVVGIVSSGGNVLQNLISGYLPGFIYVPYSTAQNLLGRMSFDQIAVRIGDAYDVDESGEIITHALAVNSGVKNGYRAENLAQQKDKLNKILDIITLILSAVAAISLVVAGLGIMTMMLVSVRERTREIGIKKSIGAKTGTIMLEFLGEALTISLAGSVLGSAAGAAIALIVQRWIGFEMALNPNLIVFSVAFALFIGIIFGVYPSHKASKLNPVDALRQE